MSKAYIPLALRKQVREHFSYRCAYCLSPEWIIGTAFTVDHIIPEALGGETTFHPYLQVWFEHFSWQDKGLQIVGLTPTGRATVEALKLNRVLLVDARRWWIEAGWHPPEM